MVFSQEPGERGVGTRRVGRKRGPTVLERLRADEESAAEHAAATSERSRKRRKTVTSKDTTATTGGMVMNKTGMVLARAVQR